MKQLKAYSIPTNRFFVIRAGVDRKMICENISETPVYVLHRLNTWVLN